MKSAKEFEVYDLFTQFRQGMIWLEVKQMMLADSQEAYRKFGIAQINPKIAEAIANPSFCPLCLKQIDFNINVHIELCNHFKLVNLELRDDFEIWKNAHNAQILVEILQKEINTLREDTKKIEIMQAEKKSGI